MTHPMTVVMTRTTPFNNVVSTFSHRTTTTVIMTCDITIIQLLKSAAAGSKVEQFADSICACTYYCISPDCQPTYKNIANVGAFGGTGTGGIKQHFHQITHHPGRSQHQSAIHAHCLSVALSTAASFAAILQQAASKAISRLLALPCK